MTAARYGARVMKLRERTKRVRRGWPDVHMNVMYVNQVNRGGSLELKEQTLWALKYVSVPRACSGWVIPAACD